MTRTIPQPRDAHPGPGPTLSDAGTRPKIIVGLSSTPSRVNEISPTLLDLLRQDVKADEIVLSLPKISARFGVPYTITDPTVRLLIDSGLVTLNELDDDYGPATKFVGLLSRSYNPNDLMVWCDDDIHYTPPVLGCLVENVRPGTAVGLSGFRMKGSDYKVVHPRSHLEEVHILEGFSTVATYRKNMPRLEDLNANGIRPQTPQSFKTLDKIARAEFLADDYMISRFLRNNGVSLRIIKSNRCNGKHASTLELGLDSTALHLQKMKGETGDAGHANYRILARHAEPGRKDEDVPTSSAGDGADSRPRSKLIVGLSSTPSRVNEIAPTLLDLVRQDVKADEIVLSLPKISARFGVPYTITDPTVRLLIDSGLVTLNELDDDYGPATKFVGLLLRPYDPNDVIVWCDDDIHYTPTVLGCLVAHVQPGTAVGLSGFWMRGPGYKAVHARAHLAEVDILQGFATVATYRRNMPRLENLNAHGIRPQTPQSFKTLDKIARAEFLSDDYTISRFLSRNRVKLQLIKTKACNTKKNIKPLKLGLGSTALHKQPTATQKGDAGHAYSRLLYRIAEAKSNFAAAATGTTDTGTTDPSDLAPIVSVVVLDDTNGRPSSYSFPVVMFIVVVVAVVLALLIAIAVSGKSSHPSGPTTVI